MEGRQFEVFAADESWSYFQRNYAGKDLRSLPVHPHLERLYQSASFALPDGGSVLEIGCSGANNLHGTMKRFRAVRGAGTEPSAKLVEHLRQIYPELRFETAPSHVLPFADGEFDLTIVHFVFHWVDRARILQSIGEAIRVTRQYLVVSDFAPTRPYSVAYHHRSGCLTYKMDFDPLLRATGLVQAVASVVESAEDEYEAVRSTLYRLLPIEVAFPVKTREELQR